MRYLVFFIALLISIAIFVPSFAQEKNHSKQPQKHYQEQTNPPKKFDLIYRVAKGKRFESQDSKNVSFTLKPNKAFITITF